MHWKTHSINVAARQGQLVCFLVKVLQAAPQRMLRWCLSDRLLLSICDHQKRARTDRATKVRRSGSVDT